MAEAEKARKQQFVRFYPRQEEVLERVNKRISRRRVDRSELVRLCVDIVGDNIDLVDAYLDRQEKEASK